MSDDDVTANEDGEEFTILGWIILLPVLALILWVVGLVISIPIAKYGDKLRVVEYAQEGGALTLERHVGYFNEDRFLGMPALVYSIFEDQPTRFYKTAYGEIIDLHEMDIEKTLVINSVDRPLYNEPVTYGDTVMRDESLTFSIDAKSYAQVSYYSPESIGCDNAPPDRSSALYVNWTTLKPSHQCAE